MSRAGRAAAGRSAALPDGPIFFDTNVIVYAYDAADAVRREQALVAVREAMRRGRLVISAQVMQEFYSVVVRQRFLQPADAIAALRLLADHTVVPANADSALRALALQQRYQLSVWDALIVQSALDARCALLFSEDLQDGQRFESPAAGGPAVTVVNPFAMPAESPAAHEPATLYRVAAKQRRAVRAPM
ncbi:MAG: PIN domain-containing protein [Betaproteobacteria bacterium]|nr:MAG: PIN domain-containing protein [Betaproteobacteria bacterium]